MGSGLLMTTGIGFEGYRVISYCGVISKEVVFRNGVGKSIGASLANLGDRLTLSDTELTGSTALIENAKSYLREQFESEVRKKGANAVLGVDFESSFGVDFVRAAMSGTAVVIEEDLSQTTVQNSEGDTEEDRIPTIEITHSNIISPLIPLEMRYNPTSRGITAALYIRSREEGLIGDIKADVIFTNRFKDTFKVENCCFLNFVKVRRNGFLSSWTRIELPDYMSRCLESSKIVIKKYFYNSELLEENRIELIDGTTVIEQVPPVDGLSIANELQKLNNAQEMLDYIRELEEELPEEIYSTLTETLQKRWDMERKYGANKKSTIAVVERLLSSKE